MAHSGSKATPTPGCLSHFSNAFASTRNSDRPGWRLSNSTPGVCAQPGGTRQSARRSGVPGTCRHRQRCPGQRSRSLQRPARFPGQPRTAWLFARSRRPAGSAVLSRVGRELELRSRRHSRPGGTAETRPARPGAMWPEASGWCWARSQVACQLELGLDVAFGQEQTSS